MSILESAKRRYSCKHFDTSKKISAEDIFALEEIVRLSPSSLNIQPWHLFVAENMEGKEKIASSTQGFYQFNQRKVLDASHVMLLCVKTDLNDAHLEKLIAKEDADGRFKSPEILQRAKEVRNWFLSQHATDKDRQSWATHQVYLALGQLLLAAADMGIDTLPIEGFDKEILSQALNLPAQNLEPVALVALGYSTADDFNKHLAKSRFEFDDVVTVL